MMRGSSSAERIPNLCAVVVERHSSTTPARDFARPGAHVFAGAPQKKFVVRLKNVFKRSLGGFMLFFFFTHTIERVLFAQVDNIYPANKTNK